MNHRDFELNHIAPLAVLILVQEDSEATLLVRSIVLFLGSMSVLLPAFVPKILAKDGGRRRALRLNKHVSVMFKQLSMKNFGATTWPTVTTKRSGGTMSSLPHGLNSNTSAGTTSLWTTTDRWNSKASSSRHKLVSFEELENISEVIDEDSESLESVSLKEISYEGSLSAFAVAMDESAALELSKRFKIFNQSRKETPDDDRFLALASNSNVTSQTEGVTNGTPPSDESDSRSSHSTWSHEG